MRGFERFVAMSSAVIVAERDQRPEFQRASVRRCRSSYSTTVVFSPCTMKTRFSISHIHPLRT